MQFSFSVLLAMAVTVTAGAKVERQCVTLLSAHPNAAPSTILRPARTVTLFRNAHAVRQTSPPAARDANLVEERAATVTVTARPVAATSTYYITTGPPPGTTTITSYTLHVPQPSLASPALQRRNTVPMRVEARDASAATPAPTDGEAETNGVSKDLFGKDPHKLHGRNVYCSDVVTVTASVSKPVSTVTAAAAPALNNKVVANAAGDVTVTVTPTTKFVVKTSYVTAQPTATVVAGGYDVCNPKKAGKLEDWSAYKAEATAFGISSFDNITDPGSCCAAAANIPGALAWSICDGSNGLQQACTQNKIGPCFVTYLKNLRGVTTVEQQCVASSNASTFQYRAGGGQIGGPLQCASTYEAYNCFKPVLLLVGPLICLPAK